MYLSQAYQETKARLAYFLKDRMISSYLYGSVDSGKTSLLRLIAQEVNDTPEPNAVWSLLAMQAAGHLQSASSDPGPYKTGRDPFL